MNPYVALLIGVACAAIGGELFVRGTVGLARWARISPGIVAATVAAFATSSPELSVSIGSAVAGKPQIGLGDALGSNVVNVALILGCALLVAGLQSPRAALRRDFPTALLVPVVTAVLLLDGTLSRLDGVLLLSAFAVWLIATIAEARRQRSVAADILGSAQPARAVVACVAGLALLVSAGYFIVMGARGIALAYGVGEFIIGATVVAVGTSVPELATTMIARLRGHDEVGLGTILGSNIFNGLCIVAIAAIIHPIVVPPRSVLVALVCGFAALLVCYPDRSGFIGRRRGPLLLTLYAGYLIVVLIGGGE